MSNPKTGSKRKGKTFMLACVAGRSESEHETFCGEAREGIFARGVAASEIPACLISYPF